MQGQTQFVMTLDKLVPAYIPRKSMCNRATQLYLRKNPSALQITDLGAWRLVSGPNLGCAAERG
jgi:hypothetical protein